MNLNENLKKLGKAGKTLSESFSETERKRKVEQKRAMRRVEMRTEEEAAVANGDTAHVRDAVEGMKRQAKVISQALEVNLHQSKHLLGKLGELHNTAMLAARALPPTQENRAKMTEGLGRATEARHKFEAALMDLHHLHKSKVEAAATKLHQELESLAKLF
jgi:hypothetical protein